MENHIDLNTVPTASQVDDVITDIINYGLRPTDITFVLGVARQTVSSWRNGTRPISERRFNNLLELREKAKVAYGREALPLTKLHKERMYKDYLMKLLYKD